MNALKYLAKNIFPLKHLVKELKTTQMKENEFLSICCFKENMSYLFISGTFE